MKRRLFLATAALTAVARAQNLVPQPPAGPAGNTQSLPDGTLEKLLAQRPAFNPSAAWQRAVDEWLRGHPWRPFQHTLGISGRERYFDHPDETFYALSLVKPDKAETARAIRAALLPWLEKYPPFASDGLAPEEGMPCEPYDVPAALLLKDKRPAPDLFGVYALWLFHERLGVPDDIMAKLRPALDARVHGVLKDVKPLDPGARGKAAIAVRELNGNIAGLLAFLRLCPDSPLRYAATIQLQQFLRKRVDFEVLNPHVWTPSDLADKQLHTAMLPRWQRLVPELGSLLAAHTGGLAAQRVKIVRESMPTWWIARGDRLSGGENYTSPLHIARSLFSAAALIEQLPPATLTSWLDVPWCRGDLAWIERAAWCGGK